MAQAAEFYAAVNTENRSGFSITYAELCERIDGTYVEPISADEQIAIFNAMGKGGNSDNGFV